MKKKDTTKKLVRHDLKPLIEELESLQSNPRPGLVSKIWLAVGLVILVGGLSGLSWFLSGADHHLSQLVKQVQNDQSSFKWTEEKFINLEMGMSEDEVVAAYGPADERQVYEATDSVVLTYQLEDPVQFKNKVVTLSFSSKLVSKFSYALDTGVVSPLDDASQVYTFTEEDITNLRVGNNNTGQGGISLTDVLNQYGRPTDVTVSLYEQAPSIYISKSGLERPLMLSYKQP